MARRARGTGSVQKRPDGRWLALIKIGERQQSHLCATQGEADTWARETLADAAKGNLAPAKMTVTSFIDEWLGAMESKAAHNTMLIYRWAGKKITKHMGSVKLRTLSPQQVQSAFRSMSRAGETEATISAVRKSLITALNKAVKWEYIDRNPAAITEPNGYHSKEREPLPEEDIGRFLEVIAGHPFEPIWILLATTGLRSGEALGLTWPDIDLENCTVRVWRQLQRQEGHWVLKELKTRKGRRVLGLTSTVVAMLRSHRVRQNEARLLLGPSWANAWDLVFTGPDGRPLCTNSLTNVLRRRSMRAGLVPLGNHKLRHTAASVWIEDGMELPVVSKLLGHTSVATTANIYSHLLAGAKIRAASVMEKRFGRSKKA